MTAQIPETIIYDAKRMAMCTEPLDRYLILSGKSMPFATVEMSCCWRGYVGTWEIVDDRLYLIELNPPMADSSDISLDALFPGFCDRVFAHWYSGTLRIPQGRQLQYVHMGYASSYERDLLIKVSQGVVVGKTVKENGVADIDAPEGYGIAATTILPSVRSNVGES